MTNPKRSRLRALLLCGATALAPAALAADRPADDAGAKTIADFLAAYAGKAVLPSVKVSQEGATYHVAFDLGAATTAMKSAGIVYDPVVLHFKVFQQDDGQWRLESEPMPPISAHVTPRPGQPNAVKMDVRIDTVNLKNVTLIDPKLNWVASVHGGADKISVVEHGPGIDEALEFVGLKADGATTSGASGLVTMIHEPMQSMKFSVDVDPKAVDPAAPPRKAFHLSGQAEGANADLSLAEFQPQPLLDAWRFLVAHPERADAARDFDTLKSALTALAADHLKLSEQASLDKLDLNTDAGPIAIEGVSGAVGLANTGPTTGFFERVSVRGIKLPDSMAPPMYGPLIPVSFHVGFKATGFDIEAAVQEWISDAKLGGDGPVLSKEDQQKLSEKLIGGRPIVVEIEPSQVLGPKLDLSFEGRIIFDHGDRTSAIKVTLRDYAKTEEALQGLPPELALQLAPAFEKAKGLAAAEPDGSLVWVIAVGHDHMVKVNGLAIQKSPF